MSACLSTAHATTHSTPPGTWNRASTAGTRRWLDAVVFLWRELERRGRLRRMLDLDDRLLDDAGVTREEIRRALRLPLRERADRALHARARRRRAEDRRRKCRRKPVTGLRVWK